MFFVLFWVDEIMSGQSHSSSYKYVSVMIIKQLHGERAHGSVLHCQIFNYTIIICCFCNKTKPPVLSENGLTLTHCGREGVTVEVCRVF